MEFVLMFGSLIVGLIVTARVAEGRNRAWWAWSAAALILWAIATLPNMNTPLTEWPWLFSVIVVWLPLAFMRFVLSSTAHQTCPHCRAKIPGEATVCRYCQREVVAVTATPAP